MNNYQIYCLSFKNPTRKLEMENRFKQLNLDCIFYDGVDLDDPRMQNNIGWSIMLGALDIIKKFYDSEKEFGIFCEDDVFIHKDLKIMLPSIIEDFKLMNLDILLLGYLVPFEIKSHYSNFELKSYDQTLNYVYHNYPDDLWGGQMFMFSKKHAKYLLEKYTIEYANKTLIDNTLSPFSGDFTLTKQGNRALIYPMLAVETADKIYSDYGQDIFHKNCNKQNYDSTIYI